MTELFAPHIHQQRIDTWPEQYPIMVDCSVCKAAVDAAEACGQVVVGIGLGGTGSHCDAAVHKPVATYVNYSRLVVVPSLGAPHCSPSFESPDA